MDDWRYLEELQEIIFDYNSINKFISTYKKIDFIRFDYYTSQKVSLFLVHENIDFNVISSTVDFISKYLKSIICIFEKPIIQLKEIEDILPIEMVHKINNDTFNYATIHSELLENYTQKGIKPRKLLTRTYDNNFSIYENQIFAQTIDDVLIYLRKNLKEISGLIFTNRDYKFNLLERLNHVNYFLAVGKLYSSYLRNFNEYYSIALPICNKITRLYNKISGYTRYKVYRLNKNRPKRLPLKLTNILKMQKNYHNIYLLEKKLNFIKPNQESFNLTTLKKFDNGYYYFCSMIILFAITHFNFKAGKNAMISFDEINNEFKFKKWGLSFNSVMSNNYPCFTITVEKEKTYRILLVPYKIADNVEFKYDKTLQCNKIIKLTPFVSDEENLYISNLDLDSFLRIQQIILKAMIESDTVHEECPFCGDKLKKTKEEGKAAYVCSTCRTKIEKIKCSKCNKYFFATSIDKFLIDEDKCLNNTFGKVDYSKLLFYRNITKINEFGEPICPHCDKDL